MFQKNKEWTRVLGDQKKLLENVYCIAIVEVIGDLSYSCFGAML